MVITSVKTVVRTEGPLLSGGMLPLLKTALSVANAEIRKESMEAAKQDFLKKKKAMPKIPSMIIDSFEEQSLSSDTVSSRGIVFAGGPSAPYAIYVDQDHRLRNNKMWRGYGFMDVGAEHGANIGEEAIINAFKVVGLI